MTSAIPLKEVLYVSQLAANLLSVSKIAAKGNKVVFSGDSCKVKNSKGRIVAVATLQGGVYRLKTTEARAWAVRKENKADLWHRRLGHLNRNDMNFLKKKKLDKGLEGCMINKEKYEMCVSGKNSKFPFKRTGKRDSELLQLVHSDVCSPMSVNSIGGARYMLTFIDDCSRNKFVFFIK